MRLMRWVTLRFRPTLLKLTWATRAKYYFIIRNTPYHTKYTLPSQPAGQPQDVSCRMGDRCERLDFETLQAERERRG
jgi:hypothetical protein